MKIAVTGKGGVGKTTLVSVLAGLYARDGKNVLAVDVDPDSNLGLALGFTESELESITPISEMSDLIAERTGSTKDSFGKFFKINPQVHDIPDKFAREKNGVRLLVMGTVETGGGGCVCPEHVLLKRIVSHLVVDGDSVVIMDMEAGLEHLGRGTAGMVDFFIVVTEPGSRSIQTYHRIKQLARDLGVKKVYVVGNKIRSDGDREFIESRVDADDLLGFISYSDDVIDADKREGSPFETGEAVISEIEAIKKKLG
ncbi:MAG: carbon monoxide dehydrogenase accessory protein CooC [Clostridiales bacterium]|nr:carbon monoxide dehydrogenase accessory protein CooC [Clostridiales bacterium]